MWTGQASGVDKSFKVKYAGYTHTYALSWQALHMILGMSWQVIHMRACDRPALGSLLMQLYLVGMLPTRNHVFQTDYSDSNSTFAICFGCELGCLAAWLCEWLLGHAPCALAGLSVLGLCYMVLCLGALSAASVSS